MMLIIAVLTIVAFAFLYDYNKQSARGPDDLGKIYGRTIRRVDWDRTQRYFHLSASLKMMDMLNTLVGRAPDEETAKKEFLVNLEVIRHEAKEWGIKPTNTEIGEGIKKLPVFQTNGEFDFAKYQQFVDPNMGNKLGPLGFTDKQIEDLVEDSLKVSRIKELLNSQVVVDDSKINDQLKNFQTVDAQVVRFNIADAMKKTSVTPDQVTRYYEENKIHLKEDELRSVQYVKVDLPSDFSTLKSNGLTERLQKLADGLTTFVEQARSKGFDFAAKAAGYKVQSTPEFTATGDTPAGKIDGSVPLTDLAGEAFRLKAVNDVSDAIQTKDAFYVISLAKISAERQLTIEEVRPKIQEHLQGEAARKSMEIAAQATIENIRQAMKQGKTFADAAKEFGLTPQSISNVSPMPTSEESAEKVDTEGQAFAAATVFLRDGEMGGYEKAPWGGYAVYLAKRNPAPADLVAKQKPMIEKAVLNGSQQILFAEWLRSSREAANISFARIH